MTENLLNMQCSNHFSRPFIITQSDIKAAYYDIKLELTFFFLIYLQYFTL